MNSNPKLDLHPDAESLSAFAEQALPEQERDEIVAHLAVCGRCREVVYLTQAAATAMEPEMELAVAAAAPCAVVRKDSRLRRWRLAWVSAGVLAAGFSVAYFAHERRVEIAAEQAKTAQKAAVQNAEMAGIRKEPEMETQLAPAPPTAGPKTVTAQRLESAAREAKAGDAGTGASMAVSVPAGGANAAPSTMSEEAAPPAGASVAGYPAMRAAANTLEPGPAGGERAQASTTGAFAAQSRAEETLPGTRSGLEAAGLKSAGETTGMLKAARSKAQFNAGLKQGSAAALPGGLPAVSIERAQNRAVAVDGAGGVYVSEDEGIHWEAVEKQWSGCAVLVRMQKGAVAGEGDVALAGGVFELVNDHGQVWVSTDGRNWKAK